MCILVPSIKPTHLSNVPPASVTHLAYINARSCIKSARKVVMSARSVSYACILTTQKTSERADVCIQNFASMSQYLHGEDSRRRTMQVAVCGSHRYLLRMVRPLFHPNRSQIRVFSQRRKRKSMRHCSFTDGVNVEGCIDDMYRSLGSML